MGKVIAAVSVWRDNPERALARLVVSFLIGQGIFWRFGYDQLGIGMNPKREFGAGQSVAEVISRRLPVTAKVAWSIKFLEIVTDFAKAPIEGYIYRAYGIVPDAVAQLVTQPAWSVTEGLEKSLGVVLHPDRVATREQLQLSLACIYGSCFRYALALCLIMAGDRTDRYLADPLERLFRKATKRG